MVLEKIFNHSSFYQILDDFLESAGYIQRQEKIARHNSKRSDTHVLSVDICPNISHKQTHTDIAPFQDKVCIKCILPCQLSNYY